MKMPCGPLLMRIAWIFWLGPLGLLAAIAMRFLGFSEDATTVVFELALVLIGFSMLLAILILNASKELTAEDRKSWRLLFFMGGPIAGCAFLTRRNRHIGQKPLNILLGDKRK